MLSKIANRNDAEIYSEKLKDCINLPVHFRSAPSVGVSIYPGDGDSIELLLKTADNSMYVAKRSDEKQAQTIIYAR